MQVWDLNELTLSSPPSPSPPHSTLHLSSNPASTPIWLRPGLLATYSTSSSPYFMVRRHFPTHHFSASFNSELWDISQHLKAGRGRLAYQLKHIYNSQSVKLEAPPTTVAYINGVLVMGDGMGVDQGGSCNEVKACLQRNSDHKGGEGDGGEERVSSLRSQTYTKMNKLQYTYNYRKTHVNLTKVNRKCSQPS